MSPEEIQAMAKGLAEGQAVWYLGSAVIGGAITGLTAYLAEKGKNQATKEAFAEVREQLKQTNKDAAQIRQLVEGQGWLAQQRWARREKHYIEMLQALHGYERACEGIAYYIEGTPEKALDVQAQVFADMRSATKSLYSAFAVAELFLAKEACTSIDELLYNSAVIFEGAPKEMARQCHEKAETVRAVRNSVKQQAKLDLAALDDQDSPL